MKMPFGKFKGKDLEDIDTDYLRWVAENIEGRTELVSECENQLAMREGRGCVRTRSFDEPDGVSQVNDDTPDWFGEHRR